MSVRQWFTDALLYKSDKSLSFLLVFLLLLIFVVYPFFPPGGFGKVVIDVFTSLVLISSTFAIERRNLAVGGLRTCWLDPHDALGHLFASDIRSLRRDDALQHGVHHLRLHRHSLSRFRPRPDNAAPHRGGCRGLSPYRVGIWLALCARSTRGAQLFRFDVSRLRGRRAPRFSIASTGDSAISALSLWPRLATGT